MAKNNKGNNNQRSNDRGSSSAAPAADVVAPTSEIETAADTAVADDTSLVESDTAGTGDAAAPQDADLNEAPATQDAAPIVGSVMESTGAPAAPAVVVADEAPAMPAPGSIATLQANEADATQLDMYRMRLDDYIASMGRAVPVTPKDGAVHQLRLYRLITEILRQEGTVFTRAWSDLLAKVHGEARGAFSADRAFRFFDQLKLENAEIRVFTNLLHLIIHTADPMGRPTMLKNIDMGSVTVNVPVPGAADKLTSFYAP